MLNCILIDDEPLALEVTKKHLSKISFIDLKEVFQSAIDAIEFLNKENIDLIFLDINMPEISGLQFRELINKDVQIIFITAYEQHALESYNLNATDYLLKPVSFDRLYKAAQRAQSRQNQHFLVEKFDRIEKFILVRGDKKILQILIEDIRFIESLKDYARIHYGEHEKIIIRERLKNILDRLSPLGFVQIHRSYIVNLDKIIAIDGNQVKVGGGEIPVSKIQREKLMQKFSERGILGDHSKNTD